MVPSLVGVAGVGRRCGLVVIIDGEAEGICLCRERQQKQAWEGKGKSQSQWDTSKPISAPAFP